MRKAIPSGPKCSCNHLAHPLAVVAGIRELALIAAEGNTPLKAMRWKFVDGRSGGTWNPKPGLRRQASRFFQSFFLDASSHSSTCLRANGRGSLKIASESGSITEDFGYQLGRIEGEL